MHEALVFERNIIDEYESTMFFLLLFLIKLNRKIIFSNYLNLIFFVLLDTCDCHIATILDSIRRHIVESIASLSHSNKDLIIIFISIKCHLNLCSATAHRLISPHNYDNANHSSALIRIKFRKKTKFRFTNLEKKI